MTDTKQREIDCRQVASDRTVVKIHFPVAVICQEIQVSIQYHLATANIGQNSQRYMKRVETLMAQLMSCQRRMIFKTR